MQGLGLKVFKENNNTYVQVTNEDKVNLEKIEGETDIGFNIKIKACGDIDIQGAPKGIELDINTFGSISINGELNLEKFNFTFKDLVINAELNFQKPSDMNTKGGRVINNSTISSRKQLFSCGDGENCMVEFVNNGNIDVKTFMLDVRQKFLNKGIIACRGNIVTEYLGQETSAEFINDGVIISGTSLFIRDPDIKHTVKITNNGDMKLRKPCFYADIIQNNGEIHASGTATFSASEFVQPESGRTILMADADFRVTKVTNAGSIVSNDFLRLFISSLVNSGMINSSLYIGFDNKSIIENTKTGTIYAPEVELDYIDEFSNYGLLAASHLFGIVSGGLHNKPGGVIKVEDTLNFMYFSGTIINDSIIKVRRHALFCVKSLDNNGIVSTKFLELCCIVNNKGKFKALAMYASNDFVRLGDVTAIKNLHLKAIYRLNYTKDSFAKDANIQLELIDGKVLTDSIVTKGCLILKFHCLNGYWWNKKSHFKGAKGTMIYAPNCIVAHGDEDNKVKIYSKEGKVVSITERLIQEQAGMFGKKGLKVESKLGVENLNGSFLSTLGDGSILTEGSIINDESLIEITRNAIIKGDSATNSAGTVRIGGDAVLALQNKIVLENKGEKKAVLDVAGSVTATAPVINKASTLNIGGDFKHSGYTDKNEEIVTEKVSEEVKKGSRRGLRRRKQTVRRVERIIHAVHTAKLNVGGNVTSITDDAVFKTNAADITGDIEAEYKTIHISHDISQAGKSLAQKPTVMLSNYFRKYINMEEQSGGRYVITYDADLGLDNGKHTPCYCIKGTNQRLRYYLSPAIEARAAVDALTQAYGIGFIDGETSYAEILNGLKQNVVDKGGVLKDLDKPGLMYASQVINGEEVLVGKLILPKELKLFGLRARGGNVSGGEDSLFYVQGSAIFNFKLKINMDNLVVHQQTEKAYEEGTLSRGITGQHEVQHIVSGTGHLEAAELEAKTKFTHQKGGMIKTTVGDITIESDKLKEEKLTSTEVLSGNRESVIKPKFAPATQRSAGNINYKVKSGELEGVDVKAEGKVNIDYTEQFLIKLAAQKYNLPVNKSRGIIVKTEGGVEEEILGNIIHGVQGVKFSSEAGRTLLENVTFPAGEPLMEIDLAKLERTTREAESERFTNRSLNPALQVVASVVVAWACPAIAGAVLPQGAAANIGAAVLQACANTAMTGGDFGKNLLSSLATAGMAEFVKIPDAKFLSIQDLGNKALYSVASSVANSVIYDDYNVEKGILKSFAGSIISQGIQGKVGNDTFAGRSVSSMGSTAFNRLCDKNTDNILVDFGRDIGAAAGVTLRQYQKDQGTIRQAKDLFDKTELDYFNELGKQNKLEYCKLKLEATKAGFASVSAYYNAVKAELEAKKRALVKHESSKKGKEEAVIFEADRDWFGLKFGALGGLPAAVNDEAPQAEKSQEGSVAVKVFGGFLSFIVPKAIAEEVPLSDFFGKIESEKKEKELATQLNYSDEFRNKIISEHNCDLIGKAQEQGIPLSKLLSNDATYTKTCEQLRQLESKLSKAQADMERFRPAFLKRCEQLSEQNVTPTEWRQYMGSALSNMERALSRINSLEQDMYDSIRTLGDKPNLFEKSIIGLGASGQKMEQAMNQPVLFMAEKVGVVEKGRRDRYNERINRERKQYDSSYVGESAVARTVSAAVDGVISTATEVVVAETGFKVASVGVGAVVKGVSDGVTKSARLPKGALGERSSRARVSGGKNEAPEFVGGNAGKIRTFSSEARLQEHFAKHGSEFKGVYTNSNDYLLGANNIIKNGDKVVYNYMGTERTGYVKFMGNSKSPNLLDMLQNKSKSELGVGKNHKPFNAKFEFVAINDNGQIATYHVKNRDELFKLLNGCKKINEIKVEPKF